MISVSLEYSFSIPHYSINFATCMALSEREGWAENIPISATGTQELYNPVLKTGLQTSILTCSLQLFSYFLGT